MSDFQWICGVGFLAFWLFVAVVQPVGRVRGFVTRLNVSLLDIWTSSQYNQIYRNQLLWAKSDWRERVVQTTTADAAQGVACFVPWPPRFSPWWFLSHVALTGKAKNIHYLYVLVSSPNSNPINTANCSKCVGVVPEKILYWKLVIFTLMPLTLL